MKQGKIFILSGPSGSGKTTLYRKLLLSRRLKGKLVKSLSLTTRSRRSGEKNGRDYIFIGKNDFLNKKKAGYFLEWQKVFDNYYGTPKVAVLNILSQGKHVLLAIDVKGAKVVWRKFPKAVKIFVKTPSWKVLKERLYKRASESKEILSVRLRTARLELKEAKYYAHVVINDKLPKAYKKLESIIFSEIEK